MSENGEKVQNSTNTNEFQIPTSFEMSKVTELKIEKPSQKSKEESETNVIVAIKESSDSDEDNGDVKNGNGMKTRLSTREIQNYHLLGFILTIRASVIFWVELVNSNH